MGRNAKLRKERKLSQGSTNQTTKKKNNSVLARASSLVKEPQTSPTKQLSWSEKFWDWINPLPKVDKYQTQIDAVEFGQENEVLISAIAWEGFSQHGKGLVLIEEKQDEETIFKYISRYKVKNIMTIKGVDPFRIEAMSGLIKSYEPTKEVISIYITQGGEIATYLSTPKDSSPSECYQMLKGEKND